MADNGFGGWGGSGGGAPRAPEIVFSNVRILDGTGEKPYSGEVTVSGNRIKSIARSGSGGFGWNSQSNGGSQRIDGRGMTLMPGLIDAHLHLSWNNAPGINPIQMMPVEEHMLNCVYMAKLLLDAGFTAGYGAAAAKPRLDVVIRDAIRSGKVPGPRYTAAGPELTSVGGLGDASLPHIPHEGLNLGIVVSGAEDMRRKVRELMKWGVDTIKLNLSGEEITGMGAEENQFTDEEVRVACEEAKGRHRRLAAHARSKESIQRCVKFGIDIIYHASFTDEQTLDMLEANKDKHFVAPGLAWLINTARNAAEYGIKPGTPMTEAYERELEHAVESMRQMHKRGIRVLIGGDYGFAWTPHGTNAKDLQYFVEMVGMSPMEAIQAGTKLGGEIMGMGHELGMIKEGYLADMLLVDGDPSTDVRVLQDHKRIVAIMQDGAFHKAPSAQTVGMRL
ncbi:MAG: amidohydrolase family protein [Alphaproteobacteria bacterium]|nr:amidohydrolase family protein [Alphaproteobacteria bacterium]MBO6863755.1 amidohydrolase family protein [Alphaproteobacteria bacterium]